MNESITNRQIVFMIFAVVIGYGIINLPNRAATEAGTGAWVPLLINTVIVALFTYFISYLGYNHENKTVFEYGQKLLGKTFGKLITIIYIVYFIILFSYLVRAYSEIVTLVFLPNTPVWSISLFLLLVAGYGITKDLGTIARLTEIYVFFVIIGFIVIQIILATQGELVNIKPILGSEDIIKYLRSSFNLFLPFLGPEIIVFIPMSREKNKGIIKHSILSIIFIGILYIFVVESTIAVVGVEDVTYYSTSLFKVLKGIDLAYLEVLRRLDGYYFIFWTMNLSCDICILALLISEQSKKIFKKIPHNVNILFILIIVFIISLAPKTPGEIEILPNAIKFLSAMTLMIIPLILFIITKVKKYER